QFSKCRSNLGRCGRNDSGRKRISSYCAKYYRENSNDLEGLKAVKALADLDIETNVTLIFNANQALLAARAGASYVSPFLGRLDDIGHDGMDLIQTISDIFDKSGIQTEIIAASIRHPLHVTDAA